MSAAEGLPLARTDNAPDSSFPCDAPHAASTRHSAINPKTCRTYRLPIGSTIQLAASRTTGWTTAAPTRYVGISPDTHSGSLMSTKRSKYDPLATSRLTRWLVLRDMFHNVLDATELPPGTDLRAAFGNGLAALERAGWRSEGATGSMVFVRRGARTAPVRRA